MRRLPDDPEEFRATLVEHIEEFRDRLLRSLFVLGIGWLGGWFAEPPLYGFLNNLITAAIVKRIPDKVKYIPAFTNATEAFMLKFKLSFVIGLIVAFPFIVYQLWGFIAPGLKSNERKPFQRLAPLTVILFAMGAGFCWFILPFAMSWFASFIADFPGTSLFQDPGSLVFLCLKMLLAFGVAFQLPLVVWVLGALNLLSAETLMQHWRTGAVSIFVLAGIITPSNDWFSMLMMAVPLTILFIISVYAVKYTQKKQKRRAESSESE